MPQNSTAATVAKNPNNSLLPLNTDLAGNLLTSSGGKSSALNVGAAAALKGSAGRLCKIVVIAVGTAGNLTFNDSATTGAAAAANAILSIPYTGLAVGQVISLEWPCANGITLSAIPTGGVVAVSFA